MSWKVLNEILGLAVIDQNFAQVLLQNPLIAVRSKGFQLTSEEERVLQGIKSQDLTQFSRHLLRALPPRPNTRYGSVEEHL